MGNTYVFSHNGYVLHSYEWYDDITRETCYAWVLKQNGELVMRSSYGHQLYDTQEKANEFIEGCVEVMKMINSKSFGDESNG